MIDLFGALPGWAKKILGISSPSAVFHEIGVNVVKGFINGLKSMGPELLDHAKDMAASAAGALAGLPGKALEGLTGGGSTLFQLLSFAKQEGITVTSTTGGEHVAGSYHYQGRAIDVAGSAAQMLQFFRDALATFGSSLKELFYDPAGVYVKNGQTIQGAIGGHSDHVHIALAAGGVVTKPTIAMIGEAGPEAVIPLNRFGPAAPTLPQVTVNVNVAGALMGSTPKEIAEALTAEISNVVTRETRRGGAFINAL